MLTAHPEHKQRSTFVCKLISFPPLVPDVQLCIGASMGRAERPEQGVEN